MIRKMLSTLALLVPVMAAALASSAASAQGYCRQWDNYPQYCQNDRNCSYDYVDQACYDNGGGQGGGNRSCSSYNRDPFTCNSQPNCYYDNQWQQCEDRGGGGGNSCSRWNNDPFTCNNDLNCQYDNQWNQCVPRGQGGGGGNSCDWYSNDPFRCNQTPGCSYDNFERRCVQGGNGGGGRLQTTTVECGSHNYGYAHCNAPGQVYDAVLINQESSSSCNQGSDWGSDNSGVWVNNGCRAYFQVRYYH